MTYSKTLIEKIIFHFDAPLGGDKGEIESIPEEVADEIESFRYMCDKKKGRVGFSNNNIFDRKRLEILCEERPILETVS